MIVRPTIRNLPIVVASILLGSVTTTAQVRADDPAVTEQLLLADATDDSLDDFSLLEGALIASGVTDLQKVEHYRSDFAHRIAAIVTSGGDGPTAITTSERVYQFLHSEILTGQYHSTCTELDRTLDEGDYNCVTATILYHCICHVHGLSPVAVATNTHVRSRFLEDQTCDVETTCREWFDVVRRDPQAQVLRTQGQVTRQLSDVQLLAKIYYNRGVSLLEKKDFDQAIALLRTSQLLDPADEPTRDNMAAGLNNWALAECDAGNFERAVELIQEGCREHSEFEPLLANDVHIHQRWAVDLCEERRYAEAMQILHAARQRRPEVALFDRGRLAVLGQWASSFYESGDLERAAKLFEEAGEWFDDLAEISRYRSLAIQAAAERLERGGRRDESDRLMRWGLELDPTDPQLQNAASRLTTADL
ncbi:MAG: tetratricopeptide repeat protein [Planctomycetota bacterium]|nr:tetratricopeptide repeat protein [Planctomycetota bacterium]